MPHCLRILFCLLALPSAASAEIIWRGDFETDDLSQWQGVTNEKKGDRVNIQIVDELVTQGNRACRFEIHGDDDFSNTQSRTQLTRRSPRTAEGADVYMASYWLMPADAKYRNQIQYWESDGYKNNVDFWVEPKESGGTVINFGTGSLGKDKHWSADFTLAQWHLIAHHIHWSQNAQEGSVSVWFDGVKVVDAIKLATKPDNQALFTQLGFHRAQRSDLVDTIYLDGVIEADSEADLLALPLPLLPGAGGSGGGGAGGVGGAGAAGTAGTSGAAPGGAPAGGTGGASGSATMTPLTGAAGTPTAPTAAGHAGTANAAPSSSSVADGSGCSIRAPRPTPSGGRDALFAALALAALASRRRSP